MGVYCLAVESNQPNVDENARESITADCHKRAIVAILVKSHPRLTRYLPLNWKLVDLVKLHENIFEATPRKNVCACVNITEICIANMLSSVPNVVKNSKWKRLQCFAFSMRMQAE